MKADELKQAVAFITAIRSTSPVGPYQQYLQIIEIFGCPQIPFNPIVSVSRWMALPKITIKSANGDQETIHWAFWHYHLNVLMCQMTEEQFNYVCNKLRTIGDGISSCDGGKDRADQEQKDMAAQESFLLDELTFTSVPEKMADNSSGRERS